MNRPADWDPPPFRRAPWLFNAHLMTLSLVWPRRRRALARGTSRWIDVGGGDAVLAHCVWQDDPRAPVVVVAHGLTGSLESSYAIGVAAKAVELGCHAIRVNARGSGGTEHRARPLGHVGHTADLARVLEVLAAERDLGPVFLIGYSMGGNQVLKLAGEWGARAPVDLRGVVAVSPAIDVAACANAIDRVRRVRVYRDQFVRRLRRMVRRHAATFGPPPHAHRIARARSIREFDELYTAPAWGFRDADDYWEQASARHVLGAVAVPALVLASRDDLLVPIATLEALAELHDGPFRFVVTEHGGHCAFVARRRGRDPDRRWAENRALEWCARLAWGG